MIMSGIMSQKQILQKKKIDFNKAINDLGHNQRSALKGIEMTINWMKNFYNV